MSGLQPSDEQYYFIEVANKGQVPVTVSQVYIGIKDNLRLVFAPNMLGGEKPLPCRLEVGDSGQWWVEAEALRQSLREDYGYRGWARVTPMAADRLGNRHKGRYTVWVSEPPWWQKFLRGLSRLLRFKNPFN